MSKTPITDGAEYRTYEWDCATGDYTPAKMAVQSELARSLEHQLNEWREKFLQQNKDLGHELRDPNGTIWDECARLQKGWEADKRLMLGALKLLEEAGIAPSSTELITAADRANKSSEGSRADS